MTRYAWQVLVIVVVLGTILVAPTWETLFAATVAVILNRVRRLDWRVDFGLRPIPWKHTLVTVLAGIALFFAVKLFLQPLCDLVTHSTRNLHSFDRIRGQPRTATLLILKTMLLAGLCEEVIFRGTVQPGARRNRTELRPDFAALGSQIAAHLLTHRLRTFTRETEE